MRCYKCGTKDLSKFYPSIIKIGYGKCKECISVYNKVWNKANPKKIATKRKERYNANPKKVIARNKSWRKATNYDTIRHKARKPTRTALKQTCIEHLSGKCEICDRLDYPIDADFHHVDPSTKSFEISMAIQRLYSWDKIKPELDKCVLLCCLCHRRLHYGIVKLPIKATKEDI